MNLKLCALLCNFLVLSTFTVVTGENVNMKKNVSKEKDIYIDDEDFADGSGNGDVIESSGSGFGPPDEEGVDNTHGEIPGPKKTQLTIPPKIEKEEPTLPMPPPKPQSPPPAPPVQPEVSVPDTYTKPTIDIQPEIRKLPEPEEKHPIDTSFNTPIDKNPIDDTNRNDNSVFISNNERDRTTSFFAQPGILAAVIGGAVVGLLCAILVVMFIVYRMRKKDEGSYALEEMKRCPATNPYMKPNHREFFA